MISMIIYGNDSRNFSCNPILPPCLSMTVYRQQSNACTLPPWHRSPPPLPSWLPRAAVQC